MRRQREDSKRRRVWSEEVAGRVGTSARRSATVSPSQCGTKKFGLRAFDRAKSCKEPQPERQRPLQPSPSPRSRPPLSLFCAAALQRKLTLWQSLRLLSQCTAVVSSTSRPRQSLHSAFLPCLSRLSRERRLRTARLFLGSDHLLSGAQMGTLSCASGPGQVPAARRPRHG